MYQETVKTPAKCSHNLRVVKVNKKPDIASITAVHCVYTCNKIAVRKPLVDISHIINVSCKQNINLTKIFHVKPPI